MPLYDNSIVNYELREPQFSMNSAGTQITARLPIYAVRDTASPLPKPSLQSGSSWWMAQSHVNAWPVSGATYETRSRMIELRDVNNHGAAGTLALGYAIVADAVMASRLAANRGPVWQSDYVQFATLPLGNDTTVPTISADHVSFTFPTPQQPSGLFLAFKGGVPFGDGKYDNSNAWYAVMTEGPPTTDSNGNLVPVLPSVFWPYDPPLFYGDLKTWYVPSVTISAAGGASVGKTTSLAINTPAWMRDLTAADLIATGGTVSNFTKVS